MTHRTSAFLVLALVAAGGLAAACTSNTNACGSGSTASLVGTYDLFEYTTGSTTIPAPAASGVLRFHTSTYGSALLLPGPTAITDSGTYSVCGTSAISESSVMGLPQFTGYYWFVGDTLAVSGTAAGTAAASVWVKRQ